jgi:predicted MPP superfamily phosphohydrolase
MNGGRIAVFLVVVLGVLGTVHYYLWTRLVRDAQLAPPWGTLATAALALLFALLVVAVPASRLLPKSASTPIIWAAFTWLGFAFFLVVLALSVDVVRIASVVGRIAFEKPPIEPERRLFLSRAIAGAIVVVALLVGLSGLREGLKRVHVKKIRISLRRIRPTRVGYRIVQLSDIHVGPTIGRDFVQNVVDQTNALNPDLIVITGDLVDGSVEKLADAVAPLADLKAKDGVYFVTGNHEYYSGVDEWLAHLATLGIRVLRNERVSIGASDGFDLAGVDDYTGHGYPGHGPNLTRALAGRDRGRVLILLAHQPKQVFEAAQTDVDLQLSGHTHGGQMFPFNFLVRLQQPYVSGFHMHEGTGIYVSNGTGYWGPPMRVGTQAEITQIELRMS